VPEQRARKVEMGGACFNNTSSLRHN